MLTPRMFTRVEPRQYNQPPIEPGQVSKFDWTGRLSIDMIRLHTKTDDVPGVTDEQLALYRDAAIEACELYTGFLLAGQRTVTEPVQGPSGLKPWKTSYRHRLKYPVADDTVYLYGAKFLGANIKFHVTPGSTTINVPIQMTIIDTSNCCDPCAAQNPNTGMMIAYKAGFPCADAVPAGLVVGMLQFIAWILEHPGDELVTQRNRLDTAVAGIQGSNNIARVSGALETWRMYDPEAV